MLNNISYIRIWDWALYIYIHSFSHSHIYSFLYDLIFQVFSVASDGHQLIEVTFTDYLVTESITLIVTDKSSQGAALQFELIGCYPGMLQKLLTYVESCNSMNNV